MTIVAPETTPETNTAPNTSGQAFRQSSRQVSMRAGQQSAPPVQTTLEDLGTPLSATTFVVVDLETTGGSPAAGAEITEIGAVKVHGGEVLGEFSTLVRPHAAIPPFISVLTGITDGMVAHAPRITSVLPSFLEFARGAVLVAHNAPFDIGFLRAAATEQGLGWPAFTVLDTVRIARRVLTRDEAPNCKLSTLATLFRAATTPNHRALEDARATVDVLHGLIERLGNAGVQSVEDLSSWQSAVTPAQRRKRHLADSLPAEPGVYVFADGNGEALYIGKSRNIRSRVRTYFTASETRRRMSEMVAIAESVTPIPCATDLEAEVRELRLIGSRKPRYNRRSRSPERALWLKLTVEAFPRLSLVREVRADGTAYVGPFSSRRTAESALAAIHEALPIRQCTARLSPRRQTSACVLAEMNRCGAPCTGAQDVDSYANVVGRLRRAMEEDPGEIVQTLLSRLDSLAASQRYEEGAAHRDRLISLLRTLIRGQRMAALAAVTELSAARRLEAGGWELHVIRWGRLAGAGTAARGVDPRPVLDAVRATAESVAAPPPPRSAATPEETECVLRWLEQPGVRLIDINGSWVVPVGGAGRFRDLVDRATASSALSDPFRDPRATRPTGPPIARLRSR